jgi:hypothetical protein
MNLEVVDINLGDLEPIKMNLNENPSYDFDNGVELLMNNKKRESNNGPIVLSNIQDLEKELNDLANTSIPENGTKTLNGNGFGNWFNFSSSQKNEVPLEPTDSNLGQATKESVGGTTKTWDGFSKVNEIPLTKTLTTNPNITERDKRRKKRMMIKKLEEWYERGHIKNSTHFDLNSPYDEVEDEYETAVEDKRKKDSLKLQSWWLKTLVNSVEFANSTFDPFGFDLSGFGEQVEEDMDSYEDVFGELYEKYKGGKLAPEISILLKLGITAATINITNRALSSSTPGFRDVIKQSPELMKMFTNATVDAISQKNPGFSFASNLMNKPEQVNTSFGPPPAPMETKTHAPPRRPGTMEFTERPTRPDIAQARGQMFREEGIEIGNNYQSVHEPPQYHQEKSARPEMKGPPSNDIDNFLSALKPSSSQTPRSMNIHEEDSMVSISSLKDLQNTKMPRTTKKRVKSEKNIISLDI